MFLVLLNLQGKDHITMLFLSVFSRNQHMTIYHELLYFVAYIVRLTDVVSLHGVFLILSLIVSLVWTGIFPQHPASALTDDENGG